MSRGTRRDATERGLAAVGLIVLVTLGACSKDDTTTTSTTAPTATLPFSAPSKDDLAEATGIEFPESFSDYRSVQISPRQLDVTFTMPAAEVDAFIDGSGLGPLEDAQRVIAHSSPVWELNSTEHFRGAETTTDGITRSVEVVGDGDPVTVRLTVRAGT